MARWARRLFRPPRGFAFRVLILAPGAAQPGVSQLIQEPPVADAEYVQEFFRVAGRYGRLRGPLDGLRERLDRHNRAWWWQRC